MEQKEVRGYKVFNHDWTCKPSFVNKKQYSCPGKFEEDIDPSCCHRGMHFCENAIDCFNYYRFTPENKVAEVVAYGKVVKDGDKCCTNKLEIIREISWEELLHIVNLGKNCTGYGNTGNHNTGKYNTGSYNTGDCNNGSRNTGSYNNGNRNTGDYNVGNWNVGDWNKSSFNTGCFMTEEQPIMMFNKPSDWTYNDWIGSYARGLLTNIPNNTIIWINSEGMTEEEKSEHPTYKTTGGYLKTLDNLERRQEWWDKLNDEDKETIKALPNFDPIIFKECTGITVD